MASRKRVILLGASGSIGSSTVEVVAARPDLFEFAGFSSHRGESCLIALGERFHLSSLALSGTQPESGKIPYWGDEGLLDMIRDTEADVCVNGISGAAGLAPSAAALSSGKTLALANKETMVAAGHIIKGIAKKNHTRIIPVDSEHSALFQLIESLGKDRIEELVITASGGAFRDLSPEMLENVKPEEALRHPNWSMGKRITIDSASMANKGLEVIEAAMLFDMPLERIKVLIHPQSCVHSLVRTKDGSLYAQISKPDMRLPIHNALSWPESIPCGFGKIDLEDLSFDFSAPDPRKYPLLALAYDACRLGASYPTAYNASDEVAVEAFSMGKIGFTQICSLVSSVLELDWTKTCATIEETLQIDSRVRIETREKIGRISR